MIDLVWIIHQDLSRRHLARSSSGHALDLLPLGFVTKIHLWLPPVALVNSNQGNPLLCHHQQIRLWVISSVATPTHQAVVYSG